jgi:hypothetical protein
VQVQEDYIGKVRLMDILNLLYKIPINENDFERAREQRNLISQKVENIPELKRILPQLEAMYDARIKSEVEGEIAKMSPDIEEILWKIKDKDLGKA